eukprot:jgi/Chlat1/6744/Chrsp50S06480
MAAQNAVLIAAAVKLALAIPQSVPATEARYNGADLGPAAWRFMKERDESAVVLEDAAERASLGPSTTTTTDPTTSRRLRGQVLPPLFTLDEEAEENAVYNNNRKRWRRNPPDSEIPEEEVARLDKFWRSQGALNAAQRARLISHTRIRGLYRNRAQLAKRLKALQEALPEANVIQMSVKYPDVLASDIPATIVPKIIALQKLIPNANIVRMVERQPTLLTQDPTTVAKKFKLLEWLLPNANVTRMVEKHPPLLSSDILGSIQPRLQQLMEVLPNANIQRMVERSPTMLSLDVEGNIKPKVARLRKMLEEAKLCAPDMVDQLLEAQPTLLQTSVDDNLAQKVQRLLELTTTEQRQQWAPVTLGRMLPCSHAVFDRIEFINAIYRVAGRPTAKRIGPYTIVQMSAAAFNRRYPSFPAWTMRKAAMRGELVEGSDSDAADDNGGDDVASRTADTS